MSESATENRKVDHINIVLGENVAAKGVTTGFENYRFEHCALPELSMRAIDMATSLFGKQLRAPFLISSMTGGAASTEAINLHLAEVAEELGLAMGVGSQRAAIYDPRVQSSYQVRRVAPSIVLLANLGAVQLNYGYGVEQCRRAVDMIEADALILHFNALQEAVQPEGDTDFSGLLGKIEAVCRALPVPVIAKEVGNGIGAATARRLAEAGVQAIDVAGAGGTSWSEVERFRQPTARGRRVAGTFAGWGIPTATAIQQVRAALPGLTIIGSGGIRTGLDGAKAIALGADLVASATPNLAAQDNGGPAAIAESIGAFLDELRIAMFCAGAADLAALRKTPLTKG
jgi:isopentenyl-diphosphate Delta-isomerase